MDIYIYEVICIKLTTKKDRKNNHRIVQILEFTDSFIDNVIVMYLDNNRKKSKVNCLLL